MECEEFNPVDLTVSFAGFDDHVGQELSLRVTGSTNWNPPEPGPFEEICRTSLVIPAGDFSIHEPAGAISCLAIHVDFFVDANENGAYDPPPTDHAWRLHLHPWEDDRETSLTFTFTLDPDTCTFDADGLPASCKYRDIEWPVANQRRSL